MEHYIVKGGNSLSGEVEIAGAKNAALAILAASIMTNETVTVENVPDVSDIRAILKTIEVIGGYVEKVDRHTFRINGSGISKDTPVDNEYVRKIRGPAAATLDFVLLTSTSRASARSEHLSDWLPDGLRRGRTGLSDLTFIWTSSP